jgi:ABC-type antimicrobial peptide transport system permease subunit
MFDARTMHDLYVQRAVKMSDILVQIVAGLGLIGMLLSAVGLYGLVAYSVSRRTREIGIRMALGADRGAVIWMVLRQGLRLGVLGVAIGLVAALYACRALITGLSFFAFMRVDVMVYLAIPAILLTVTVLACWGPARRAAMVDPLTSLRDE